MHSEERALWFLRLTFSDKYFCANYDNRSLPFLLHTFINAGQSGQTGVPVQHRVMVVDNADPEHVTVLLRPLVGKSAQAQTLTLKSATLISAQVLVHGITVVILPGVFMGMKLGFSH
jgi:hypothetical protein